MRNDSSLSNGFVSVSLDAGGISSMGLYGGDSLIRGPIRIASIDDTSDTWSHGISGYTGAVSGMFNTETPWSVWNEGPLRTTMKNAMSLRSSSVLWQVYLQKDEPIIRMRLRVNWNDKQKIVKLLIPTGFAVTERIDGIPGGRIARPCNGQEYPVFDFVSLAGASSALAVVSRDIFAADVQPDGMLRLTLLRCPYYAHHDPHKVIEGDIRPITDQGEHEYEIALMPMKHPSFDVIAAEITRQTAPIMMAESTKGMPGR